MTTLESGTTVAIWSSEFEWPMGSAWRANPAAPGDLVEDLGGTSGSDSKWVPFEPGEAVLKHSGIFMEIARTAVVRGNAACYFTWISNNFGHVLHDTLPMVAWMRSVAPPDAYFILPDLPMLRQVVEFLDPDFYRERAVWLLSHDRLWKWDHDAPQPDSIRIEGGTLTVTDDSWNHITNNAKLYPYLRSWISQAHPGEVTELERKVVYYSRRGKGTKHGRKLDKEQEKDVIKIIVDKMHEHGRTENLVVYNGLNTDGSPMSIGEQYNLFRPASAVIGPHGSGLANIIWTNPTPETCEDRVKVLEFISGTDSAHVQQLFHSYYHMLWGLPLDWHHITYASNSTGEDTYLRLPDLEVALDVIWGP